MLFQIYSGLVQVWSTIYLGLIEASFEVVQGLFRLFFGGSKKKKRKQVQQMCSTGRFVTYLPKRRNRKAEKEGTEVTENERQEQKIEIYIYI